MHAGLFATDPEIHVWLGASGRKYRYSVYMFGTAFGPGPANLVFAREMRPDHYVPVYVAQTGDLSEPLDLHPAMQCIRLNRATHVHVRHSTAPELVRLAECADLIRRWNPTCNAQP